MSGARITSLRPLVAMEFFTRVIGAADPALEGGEAWGAFEDRTELIAACALAHVSKSTCRLQIAVLAERRRLGVGAELLHIAMAEASRHGASMLRGSHPAGATDAQVLIASLNVTCARRVQVGQVEAVIFIPTSISPTHEGGR
jgi:GNAT superfamily N-acetyltransferase